MRIGVIGATSATGRHVVDQGVARGHAVALFAREPGRVPEAHRGLEVYTGDVRRMDDLRPLVGDRDAVVCILAPDRGGPPRVIADGVLALCRTMREGGVERVVLCSARPVVARRPRGLVALLWVLFGETYRDMARAEGVLEGSDLDWRIVRPGRLVDGVGTGRYGYDPDSLDAKRNRPLARVDLARALLDAAADDSGRRTWDIGGAAQGPR